MRNSMLILAAFTIVTASQPLTSQEKLTQWPRMYIAPMRGTLDSCFILGVNKALRKVPPNAAFLHQNGHGFVLAISDESQAEYILTSTSIKPDNRWYKTVFSPEAKQCNVVLIRIRDNKIVWMWGQGDREEFWTRIERQAPLEIGRQLAEDFIRELLLYTL